MYAYSEKLASLVRKFRGLKAAVIGDILLDSYVYGKIERLNPESAAPLLKIYDGREDYRLGGAGNVAFNVSSLGAEVDLYGPIGSDEKAEIIFRVCRDKKINLFTVRDGFTIEKKRFIESGHWHYLIRVDFGEHTFIPLSPEDENKMFELLKSNIEKYDCLILSDYNKKTFKGVLPQKIINLAKEKGKLVIVDPKPANARKFLGADLVRPNYAEAQAIVGKEIADYEELARQLKAVMQAKDVVVTLGAKGVAIYDGGFYHIPTQARDVLDVSGAGDTAVATLALSLASQASLYDSAHIANYASGIAVEKSGTVGVTNKELIGRILKEDAK